MADTTTFASTYQGALGPYQCLYLSNQGSVTTVAVVSTQSGQSQNTLQFETGSWSEPPLLYPLANNIVIAIVMTGKTHSFFRVQGTQVQMYRKLSNASTIAELKVATPTQLKPAAGIPNPPPPPPTNPLIPKEADTQEVSADHTQRFCTQCGSDVCHTDRFCAYCGHQLLSTQVHSVS